MMPKLTSKKQPKAWVLEEDDLLRIALRGCTTDDSINWHEVAAHIPGRSNKDCRKRWVYALAPNINKGPWKPEEDQILRDGVRQYGTKWSTVSRLLTTRNADQCSRRWHENLKPNINRGRWSLLEDDILCKAVKAHNRRWIEIVERYFPERTPIQAKNRYELLLKAMVIPTEDQDLISASSSCLNCDSSAQSDAPSSDDGWLSTPSTQVPGAVAAYDLYNPASMNSTTYTAMPLTSAPQQVVNEAAPQTSLLWNQMVHSNFTSTSYHPTPHPSAATESSTACDLLQNTEHDKVPVTMPMGDIGAAGSRLSEFQFTPYGA